MDRYGDHQYHSYSWHQSHDQATVLLLVPYEAQEEDVEVVIERNYILAGVRGLQPIVKGRLYGHVDTTTSMWQLEPRTSRLSARERTTSTTSTASTPSSYAFVSDPEISSSFAASLESGHVSDAEELIAPSPTLSSPLSTPADDRAAFPTHHHRRSRTSSRAISPGNPLRSLTSSFSSLESLHSPHSGRLLTIHLEKEQSIIWPSLIVGPVSEAISPYASNQLLFDSNLEYKYNMDPTSLVLIALELYDIRKDKDGAFECFVRAWHQARVPTATVRLVSHYLPLQTSFELTQTSPPVPGTTAYFIHGLGGSEALAQLYLQAGLLHLEGAASPLLSSSSSTLSSIRMPSQPLSGEGSTEAWVRDREAARRYFERARILQPELDVPLLPADGEGLFAVSKEYQLEMPSMEIHPSAPESLYSHHEDPETPVRRRRGKEEVVLIGGAEVGDMDNAWYLYIPGLVGAGTALLVVGVVGALSFSSWRRNQGS